MTKTYPKQFAIKAKGSFVGSKTYKFIRDPDRKIKTFFKKIDAKAFAKRLRKGMREVNKVLSNSGKSIKKLTTRVVKVK